MLCKLSYSELHSTELHFNCGCSKKSKYYFFKSVWICIVKSQPGCRQINLIKKLSALKFYSISHLDSQLCLHLNMNHAMLLLQWSKKLTTLKIIITYEAVWKTTYEAMSHRNSSSTIQILQIQSQIWLDLQKWPVLELGKAGVKNRYQ